VSPTITLTGADERTSLTALQDLLAAHPCLEIGLLYTETPEGRNRYPRRSWLIEAVGALGERCALHLCGSRARLEAFEAPLWMQFPGRVQVNGAINAAAVASLLQRLSTVITQHDLQKNPDLSATAIAGHALLVDASGGRGISPKTWTRPRTTKDVGFAGNLGPDNLEAQLPRIARVARGAWWVDMETKLRNEQDWFCLDQARRAVDAFEIARAALARVKGVSP